MKKVINLVIAVLAISFSVAYTKGNLTNITAKPDFRAKVLQSNKPVFVKFHATWCGACKNMRPIIDNIAGEYGATYDFVAVDVDKGSKLADQYNITSLPTIVFFKGGNKVGQVVGEKSKEELIAVMKQYLGN